MNNKLDSLFFTRLFVSERKQIALMADEKSPPRISRRLFATSRSEMRFIMYIINGICYAGEWKPDIEVIEGKILEDGMLLLVFSTGETRLFDTTILKGPAFEPLREEKNLKTMRVTEGVVTWLDGDIDCAPEYMYEHSFAYEREFM